MNSRSNISLHLLIAAALLLLNYHAFFKLTIGGSEQASFAQHPIDKPQSHYRNNTSYIEFPTGPSNKSDAASQVNILELLNLSIPIHNYKKDDPFAPQKQIGSVWKQQHKRRRTTRFFWWEHSDTCFAVDDICRTSQNRWFYFHQPSPKDNNTNQKWQPSVELKYMPYSYTPKTWADTRVQMNIQSRHLVPWEKMNKANLCRVSLVPYHVVLQSNYNDMIGEFYIRTLLDLYLLISKTFNNTIHPTESILDDIQYYVHVAYENKKILDGHKLLLSGMHRVKRKDPGQTTTAVKWAKSALELVQPNDEHGCQCFSKLVFCGYSITYTQQHNTNHTPKEDDNTKYSLWPSTHLDAGSNEIKGVSSSCEPISSQFVQDPYNCQVYSKLKSYILSNVESQYDNIDETVADFRMRMLLERNLIRSNGDSSNWCIVGLAQRSSRRVWLNLAEVIDACNSNFFGSHGNPTQVACVEINVENTTTPQEQFLLHRSLDALIGVHGAQMTQALFLKPRAHVLELLPWIPDFTRGSWTARTETPTPIGIMFHNTDLNHYGYRLNRTSVPLCEGVSNSSELDKECLTSKANADKFFWDKRDFKVDGNIIVEFISKFVLLRERTCKDLKDSAGDFVLYNVWCRSEYLDVHENKSSVLAKDKLMHFYRK